MAIVKKINKEAWEEWVAGRPPEIKELCIMLPPDRLYKMKDSGHRVTIHSYAEDGTVTVNVTGEYNALTFERQVFCISPDDLQECDLPDESDLLGVMLTDQEQVGKFIDSVRTEIFPVRKI